MSEEKAISLANEIRNRTGYSKNTPIEVDESKIELEEDSHFLVSAWDAE